MKKRTYPINPTSWMEEFISKRGAHAIEILNKALAIYNETNAEVCLQKGLAIADILEPLGLDNEALAAAIVYPAFAEQIISTDTVADQLGEACFKLLKNIMRMRLLHHIPKSHKQHQLENLRKMLLAMVTDIRSVLIVIAEHLLMLRHSKELSETDQKKIGNEGLSIYAPLANRLGIWQFKWEIEDLSLKCLEPTIYSTIAKSLSSRRHEREEYIERMRAKFIAMLTEAGIENFQIMGRVKHIFSIYKKMQRKSADFKNIYDISALRVLVNNINDCYTVLSIFQNEWNQIAEEFDDYIMHPKNNGYRSIHIVLHGPEEQILEVQIRTFEMHQESELGVAAHWRYKEGVLHTSDYETKILLLRQLMAWQKELLTQTAIESQQTPTDIFADRIYVFTPAGEIIDLPKGSTPLDFAYHIHSEVGHRCRGAKVDGNMVTLKYALKTGERVEILTAKEASPSRDWMNSHLGYLTTARARAKVQHWFRLKEGAHASAITNTITPIIKTVKNKPTKISNSPEENSDIPNIQILGINNLLTNIAGCCNPKMGDEIIGYITRARGISIHKKTCKNLLQREDVNKKRIIEVSWSKC